MTRALIRRVDALQDAHQRRFARAIAADDGVDGLRRDGEVDPIVGDDGAETCVSRLRAPSRTATRAAYPSFEEVRIALVDHVPDLDLAGQDLLLQTLDLGERRRRDRGRGCISSARGRRRPRQGRA